MNGTDAEASKKAAGEKAVSYVKDGMILGLGTGSTVRFFIEKLAAQIKEQSLDITTVPTSVASEKLAGSLGIRLSNVNEHPKMDLDVDGADEVDPKFNLIKGGGGAHTREKIIASASKEFIVIVDRSKMVSRLGNFPVPLEVLPFSEKYVWDEIVAMGGLPRRRVGFVTDSGNLILDCRFNIVDPGKLETDLKCIPGVVEDGVFARRRPEKVIVADGKNVKILERV
ncbi:MAG: ribose-5-phosphate isomerase RpiA [Candidatus Altiarchaeia archaeon]